MIVLPEHIEHNQAALFRRPILVVSIETGERPVDRIGEALRNQLGRRRVCKSCGTDTIADNTAPDQMCLGCGAVVPRPGR